jgi:co-chaperonin GroES (HSP10)
MIQVLGHRVLIKALELEQVDEAMAAAKRMGLVIPNGDDNLMRRNAVDRGTIVQVGETAYQDFGGKQWCSSGDEVYFSKYAGKYLKDPYTQEEFVLVNDEDVLAVISKGSEE